LRHAKVDGKYLCKICGKAFGHSLKLKDHIKKKHEKTDLNQAGIKLENLFHLRTAPNKDTAEITDLMEMVQEQKMITYLQVGPRTWSAVNKLSYIVPILKLLAIDGALESPLKEIQVQGIHIQEHDNVVYKCYPHFSFVKNEESIQGFTNELAIMEKASRM
jgi:hypothetical protein